MHDVKKTLFICSISDSLSLELRFIHNLKSKSIVTWPNFFRNLLLKMFRRNRVTSLWESSSNIFATAHRCFTSISRSKNYFWLISTNHRTICRPLNPFHAVSRSIILSSLFPFDTLIDLDYYDPDNWNMWVLKQRAVLPTLESCMHTFGSKAWETWL